MLQILIYVLGTIFTGMYIFQLWGLYAGIKEKSFKTPKEYIMMVIPLMFFVYVFYEFYTGSIFDVSCQSAKKYQKEQNNEIS